MCWPPGTFGAGPARGSCRQFTADLGRNFQVVYQQANAHGARVLTAGGVTFHPVERPDF